MTPVLVGEAERQALRELRQRAAAKPVDVTTLAARLATPEGKRAHMDQMNSQTVEIPQAFLVTYSVEFGHPGGAARHMSMSSTIPGRVPNPLGAWMVAQELGFTGRLADCAVFPEDLQRGEQRALSINIVQIITAAGEGRA